MRVAMYARVSTSDKNQDPETQLRELRDYCQRQEWEIADEFTDYAPAGDHGKRLAWRYLLEGAAIRSFDLVLVHRIDRAFRSVLDGVNTLARLDGWGVGFRSFTEQFIDTTTPQGRVMFAISTACAELEKAIIGERVRSGMARARDQGVTLGRPTVPVDVPLVVELRSSGMSWPAIRRAHPLVTSRSGKRVRPGVSTLKRYHRYYSQQFDGPIFEAQQE
ncbi:MAG: recombinase family protein [Chloroflexi bacterium]|nr:recombinase family protein [Chloroflexota bacterium]